MTDAALPPSAVPTEARSAARAERPRSVLLARLSEQRASAAQTLWTSGHRAEALRLQHAAVESICSAWDEFGPESTPSPVLSSRGAEALALLRGARQATLPELDDAVAPAHADDFEAWERARTTLADALADARRSPAERRRRRTLRVAAVVTFFLITGGLSAWWWLRPRIDATASAFYGNEDKYHPSVVVDGNPATEWLLPDTQAGWVEVSLSPPRDITKVRLLNAHNPPFSDRATRAFTVELRAGERVVATQSGEFATLRARPDWTDVAVRGGAVSTIRVRIDSWHSRGGGLAEVAWQ